MKTSEFIKYFEDKGFTVKYLNKVLKVFDRHNKTVLIIEKEMVNTRFIDFLTMPEEVKQEINTIIFKYLMTPPEEREEEKRYYLKIKGFSSEEETYLCAYDFWSDWILIDKDELKHGDEFYFKFTQKQIDEMPECYTHPAVWEQIEVESEK